MPWIVSSTLSAITLVGLLIFSYPVSAQEKMRVGLSSVSATNGSIWVAEEKGLFKKYGIDTEVIVIGGGGARVVSSLLAGEVQFSVGGGDGSLRAQLRGADVVIIASTLTKGLQRWMTRPSIKSWQELKGTKVAITRFGSAGHLALQLMLRKWHLSPGDVNILQLGSSPAMLASLEKGGTDGAILTMPTFFLAEDKGFRVVGDPVNMDIYYLQNTLESSRGYLRKHRDQALRFLKGYTEGIAYFKKNKRESLEIMRKKLRIQSEQERDIRYLELSYQLLATSYYNDVPYPSLKGIETVLEFIAADDPKARGADPKSFTDDSLVREIEASGLIKRHHEKP
jgi:ABC-type nitrate/sulfonate/bicarbonate transport system substrate-binding protein